MQEGILDLAVPMTYYNWASLPTDYTKWMNFEKDRKFNRQMIVGPGIYLNSLANAILELQMTRDASPAGNYAEGFCGYSYGVPYLSGTWAGFTPSLVSQVTPTWDDIPAMPWKTSPTTGHMMGTVTIAGTGAWADGAAVSITGPVSRTQTNDGTGFYAFIDLPPGSYTVTASKAGYPERVCGCQRRCRGGYRQHVRARPGPGREHPAQHHQPAAGPDGQPGRERHLHRQPPPAPRRSSTSGRCMERTSPARPRPATPAPTRNPLMRGLTRW